MNPGSFALAERALAEGRFREAERLGREALHADPENAAVLLLLGIACVRTNRPEEALPIIRKAALNESVSGAASLWLSRAYRKLGDLDNALVAAEVAVGKAPLQAPTNYQLAITHLDRGDLQAALSSFDKATQIDPNVAAAQYGRGLALQGLGQNSAAIFCFKRAAALSPKLEIVEALFQALMDESDSAGAVVCARTLLNAKPEDARSQLRMARALLADNRLDLAGPFLEQALKSGPDEASFHFAAGTVLQGLGRIDEATVQFLRSIQLLPDQGFAYSALAYNRKTGELDRPLVNRMQGLCESSELSVQARTHLHYGLGKSFEDLQEYELAFAHFDEANRLSYGSKFGDRPFDRQLYSDRIDSNVTRIIKAGFAEPGPVRGVDKRPIFVVGMLRSGTTLVDQILSSHPQVGSVGEQGFWLHHRDKPWGRDGVLNWPQLRQLAAQYVEAVAQISPNSRCIVDKMPDNYLEIPLLHMAFPNAKIIHIQRNPADTCVSIYTTINRLGVPWSHNKENIVFAYRQYERVMNEWRKFLPPGVMLEIRYEDLIRDQEKITRDLVAFCGLEWDDACLHPELNIRSVATPSAWQVRQPLYRTSIDRWRRYEPWLGEFKALLAPPSEDP